MSCKAVAEYMRRETEANKTPQGADHKAILSDVATAFELPLATLRQAVLDATFMVPN